MTAQEKLKNKFKQGLHICCGLDTDLNKIPESLKSLNSPITEFNKRIINATKDKVCAYKINFAFYERYGAKGWEYIEETLTHIPDDVLTIADAKRGDIGNTSGMYADAVYNSLKFDSVTLHPYMGYDSVEPFLNFKDKLNFVLVLTSNESSKDFETIKTESGDFLYSIVLNKVNEWNTDHNCGIVFGATKPEELKLNLKLFKDMPVLIPGVGAQGGNASEIAAIFKSENKNNFIINISRSLIYTDSREDFEKSVRDKLLTYNGEVNSV